MAEEFWNEWNEGEIHIRDHLQFELKNELFINPTLNENSFKQEFYLFIPSPLQINSQTYSKTQFYQDQTNLIRYTTPDMSLAELIDPQNSFSPIYRLKNLLNQQIKSFPLSIALDELKLFGNIFKVALRHRVLLLIQRVKSQKLDLSSIELLIKETENVLALFRQRFENQTLYPSNFQHAVEYVDEYISLSVDEFFLILLKEIQSAPFSQSITQPLIQLVEQEKNYRNAHHFHPQTEDEEAIFYRQGLLNRFMLEALMLKSYRLSLEDKQGDLLGAIAAGLAMFIYMILFVWNHSFWVINSFPFVILVVVFYILKDRLKDWLKRVFFREAYRWFPDYSTDIQDSTGKTIGRLKENFSFIHPQQLPTDVNYLRNHSFHEELQDLNRHETIIQYKRELILYQNQPYQAKRRRGLTTIFRLNIHHFLRKASNAFQPQLTLNPLSQNIHEDLLPKIYHLNMIIRDATEQNQDIKMFRLVVDKLGIKRVEFIKEEGVRET